MSLKEKLQNDLTSSMRARDEVRSSTIRMILTSIKNEEVSGKEARDLSDAEVITVLSREAKKRREAAEAFDQAGAKDRADQERAEGEII
ncbi:MAG: GatB/YqeY domain-containing protein, partial [Actinomycetota bacterium]